MTTARTATVALCLALLACGDSRTQQATRATPTHQIPRYEAHESPGGVRVLVPEPLHGREDLVRAALVEVDAAGVPDGWLVRIRESRFFVRGVADGGGSVGVWARGATHHDLRVIDVAWRFPGEASLLPALPWEASLARLSRLDAIQKDLDARRGQERPL